MNAVNQRLFAFCYGCAEPIVFDPAVAASVLIDSDTGRPVPDARRLAAGEPRPAMWRDCALCDSCADRAEGVARTLGLFPLWPARLAARLGC